MKLNSNYRVAVIRNESFCRASRLLTIQLIIYYSSFQ